MLSQNLPALFWIKVPLQVRSLQFQQDPGMILFERREHRILPESEPFEARLRIGKAIGKKFQAMLDAAASKETVASLSGPKRRGKLKRIATPQGIPVGYEAGQDLPLGLEIIAETYISDYECVAGCVQVSPS